MRVNSGRAAVCQKYGRLGILISTGLTWRSDRPRPRTFTRTCMHGALAVGVVADVVVDKVVA